MLEHGRILTIDLELVVRAREQSVDEHVIASNSQPFASASLPSLFTFFVCLRVSPVRTRTGVEKD